MKSLEVNITDALFPFEEETELDRTRMKLWSQTSKEADSYFEQTKKN